MNVDTCTDVCRVVSMADDIKGGSVQKERKDRLIHRIKALRSSKRVVLLPEMLGHPLQGVRVTADWPDAAGQVLASTAFAQDQSDVTSLASRPTHLPIVARPHTNLTASSIKGK